MEDSNRVHRRSSKSGFSMTEMLVLIAIIGAVAAIAIPLLGGMESTKVAKDKRNAQAAAEISNNLSSLDIAHVMPESLGGAAATARLIAEGIPIPEDSAVGGLDFRLEGLSEEDLDRIVKYLEVNYDGDEPRLVYNPNKT